LVFRKI
jgi:hypothetical protein